jgi:hypothetical protein
MSRWSFVIASPIQQLFGGLAFVAGAGALSMDGVLASRRGARRDVA